MVVAIFVMSALLIVIFPRYSILGLFVFAIVLSNSRQSEFIEANRGFPSPFSFFSPSGLDIIDKQGIRIEILLLFLTTVIRAWLGRRRLRERWLLVLIVCTLLLSFCSMLINNIPIVQGLSSVSLFTLPFWFLFSLLNVPLREKDIGFFLDGLFVFVVINGVFQIYQFVVFAHGDFDLTVGLLESTTQTSIIGFVIVLLVVSRIGVGKAEFRVWIAVAVALVQLVSSYIKGILAFAVAMLYGFRGIIFQGVRPVFVGAIVAGVLAVVSTFVFTEAVGESDIFYYVSRADMIPILGPVRVWTDFFGYLDGPAHLLVGYGPSSYGSINTVGSKGERSSILADLVVVKGNGSIYGRGVFANALSSAGNILWEEGIVVLFLFLAVHYWVFRESRRLYTETGDSTTRIYAFGVGQSVLFVVLLYFAAYADTTEEVFLWGPVFAVFSFIKSTEPDKGKHRNESRVPRTFF